MVQGRRIQYIIISFYQIQQRMFTPNKKKSRPCKPLHQSFEPSDFAQFNTTEPLNRKCEQDFDKQNVAKDVLIEIGESELPVNEKNSTKLFPVTIDSWVTNQVRVSYPARRDQLLENNFCFSRNARSVTAGLIKYREVEEQNTVQKLKQVLKKLESPQKARKKQNKKSQNENKNEILETLKNKRRVQTKVSDLIRLKQCQILKVNKSSTNYHSRKISSSMQNRMKKVSAPIYGEQPLDTRRLNQMFNFQYKEARRNRALKRILN